MTSNVIEITMQWIPGHSNTHTHTMINQTCHLIRHVIIYDGINTRTISHSNNSPYNQANYIVFPRWMMEPARKRKGGNYNLLSRV
uniref:Uncharacterized protein n=1 Tax=Arion vulgaris TaxID=1028688 RepID=A0A0B6YRD8_9EUPU